MLFTAHSYSPYRLHITHGVRFRMFKELWLIVAGLTAAVRTLFWASLFLFLVIFMFAVFATQMIGHPTNDDGSYVSGASRTRLSHCGRRFASDLDANLFLVRHSIACSVSSETAELNSLMVAFRSNQEALD